MTSDLDLLRQFTREHSQDAFAEIVRRYLDLVYSAALRQVRSPQLAEEIAQSVFADLARNAGKLKSNTIVTAWLYAVTRRTAIDVVRKESRRQLREQIAVEMQNMNAPANDWTQIEPLLDDAMAALDETDRAAILLRYFENKNLREVGDALDISDDAAQKRVSRAVEKLREFFSKRKITIGASGLTILISANAVQSAPVGLAAAISAAALAGTAISTSTVITATKAIAMTTLQKSIIGAALLAAVGTGIFQAHQNAALQNQIQTLRQQQTSLDAQIQQLQRERDNATNQLAGLLVENTQSRSESNQMELLRLRAEVTRLHTLEQSSTQDDPVEVAAKNWLTKVNLLKQRLDQMPNAKIPELRLVNEMDWLNAALGTAQLKTDEDYLWDLHNLLESAEDKFGKMANKALEKYAQANNGGFPPDLSQLQPYFDSPVDEAILQRYEIVPVETIPKEKELSDNWLIVQKSRAMDNYKSEGREVIGPKGYGNSWTFW